MSEEGGTSENFKMGIGLWLSFCLFVCIWFLSRFVKGRQQLRNNLTVIEDGLRRMQEEIEKRQDKCITSGEESSTIPVERASGFDAHKRMRSQKVSVDVFKMIMSSCSYLGLAFLAWVFVKLVYACFWLPQHLQKENEAEAAKVVENIGEEAEKLDEAATSCTVEDKKTI